MKIFLLRETRNPRSSAAEKDKRLNRKERKVHKKELHLPERVCKGKYFAR